MAETTRFGITGVAGYIAPRHLKAIQDVGGELVAALDPHDSVGVLDRYGFSMSSFFTEPERFDRHLDHVRRAGKGLQYLSICAPNHLHDAHARMGMRNGADIICEKPLVIKSRNLSALEEMEQETGRHIWTILQLRLHPVIRSLKEQMVSGRHRIVLDYATPRGVWYHHSWKADPEKSGGLITNIGIHFLDMLLWVFGSCDGVTVTGQNEEVVAGHLELERASVDWRLSIRQGERQRIITVDGDQLNFTDGFEDLHTQVYRKILAGEGFGIADARPSIELAQRIRNGH